MVEKKKTVLNDDDDIEIPDDDLFVDEIELNTPELNEQNNKIIETNDESETDKVKENKPQPIVSPSIGNKKLKLNKTKTQSIEKHFIKIDKSDKLVLNEKNQNIDKSKDENLKSVEYNEYKKINDTPATTIDDDSSKCKKIKEQSPALVEKNKEHNNVKVLSPSKSKDNVKIKKENSIDNLHIENGKSKSHKSKDDKSKNYKSKDDKSKNYKSKDNDKSKDDSPSSSSSKKKDLKRQRSSDKIKKSSSDRDKDSKLNNSEDSSGSDRRHLKRLCQQDVRQIKTVTIDDAKDYTKKISINCLSKIFCYLSILEIYKIENGNKLTNPIYK